MTFQFDPSFAGMPERLQSHSPSALVLMCAAEGPAAIVQMDLNLKSLTYACRQVICMVFSVCLHIFTTPLS